MAPTTVELQKILVATDFSPASQAALQQAIALAEKCGAEVAVAYVLTDLRRAMAEAPAASGANVMDEEADRVGEAIRAASNRRLERMLAPFHGRVKSLRHVTLLGVPDVALVHLVQAEGFQLVVTGTTGQGAAKRFLIGSVAERLIRHCPCPVWSVRGEGESFPATIMAAVDFDAVGAQVLRYAAWLARLLGARLIVLHSFPDPLALGDFEPDETVTQSVLRRYHHAKRTVKKRLGGFVAAHVPADTEVDLRVGRGEAWQSIKSNVSRLHVDLLVMGSVARTGIPGLVIGNTAEKVLRIVPVSLLTLKPDEFVSPISPAFWSLYPGAPSPPSSLEQDSPAASDERESDAVSSNAEVVFPPERPWTP